MEKQKKSVGTIALVVLLLIVTIASLVLATYAWAKYTSQSTGTANAEVAKWDVKFSDADANFRGTYTHIASPKIAPGASGSFDITVNPGKTETCFQYVIKIDSFEFVDANGTVIDPDTVLEAAYNPNLSTEATDAQKAANEAARVDGITTDIKLSDLRSHIVVKDGNTVLNTNSTITEQWHIDGCTASTTATSKTISWAWAYENGTDANYDKVDTAAGRYVAAGNTLKLKFNYTITATQIAPVRQNA